MRQSRIANHLDPVQAEDSVGAIAARLSAGQSAAAVGAAGSSNTMVAGAISRLTRRPVVLVVAHLDDADEAADDLAAVGVEALRFPALEMLPGESGVSLELFAERLSVMRRFIGDPDWRGVLVAPIQALMQGVPAPAKLDDLSLILRVGESRPHSAVVRWLEQAGYARVDAISEAGDFAVRGGILDIFPPGGGSIGAGGGGASGGASEKSANLAPADPGVPVRLDFFGDDIESIREIDLATMGSDRKVSSVELVGASVRKLTEGDAAAANLLDLLPKGSIAIVSEPLEVTEQGRGYYERITDARGISGPPAVFKALRERFHAFCTVSSFSGGSVEGTTLPVSRLPEFARDAAEAIRELAAMCRTQRVLVLCQSQGEHDRLGELLREFALDAPVETAVAYLHRGFVWGDVGDEPSASRATTLLPSKVVPSPEVVRHDAGPKTGQHRGTAEGALALVPYHELMHRYQTRRRIRGGGGGGGKGMRRADKAQDAFLEISIGDYVVHADHGIARFNGLVLMQPKGVKASAEREAESRLSQAAPLAVPRQKPQGGVTKAAVFRLGDGSTGAARTGQAAASSRDDFEEEYLALEFANSARLYVPATQIEKVQRYIGGFSGKPPLSVIGGKRWQNQKDQVKESVRDLAKELLRVQAARETMPGTRYPDDTAWQTEFEAEFPFEETQDQLGALAEIKKDMGTARPMDRLLCGDVGYGKTELAIRAAFKAVEYGKQVAVLVPTTILAEQHERTFRSRFADYPFRVESISRFKTSKESNDILAAARKGQVDILIGTHRLLSKDVRFADLGLVVVDEEQRFGVEHKNALLGLRMTADVLTLSATPIPRTLHMTMLGLRDISSLTTAPVDRRAVVTEVCPYNEKRIKQAIERELAREGQVFFVHNRVHNIQSVADDIHKLVPDAKILVGHGQMPDHELERVMSAFINRQADILVSTTIIESGIDIPTANTMIINMADHFGLSELHQLRGRVGRYKHRAYCYLLIPPDRPLTDIAARRLRALEEFSMLGAGFKIAMRDLEIRGAGNLLGAEQSGHIAAVGYDMYCRLLESATHDLKADKPPEPTETTLDIGAAGHFPRVYIPNESRRLDAYRRVAVARSFEELAACEKALLDAYGTPPAPARRLLELAALRIGAHLVGVRSIHVREQDVIIRCETPAPVVKVLEGVKGTVRPIVPRPGDKVHEVYFRPPPSFLDAASLLTVLRRRFAPGHGGPEASGGAEPGRGAKFGLAGRER
ncbi:MAG: transcription-repair coupling factor [Phycisphaerales bacterium]